jgi:hypothetical protein
MRRERIFFAEMLGVSMAFQSVPILPLAFAPMVLLVSGWRYCLYFTGIVSTLNLSMNPLLLNIWGDSVAESMERPRGSSSASAGYDAVVYLRVRCDGHLGKLLRGLHHGEFIPTSPDEMARPASVFRAVARREE